MLVTLVLVVPLLLVALVWVSRHDKPSPEVQIAHTTGWGILFCLVLIGLVMTSVQLESLTRLGQHGERLHRLGLATFFATAASILVDHGLAFYRLTKNQASWLTWLRNWLLISSLALSVLHVFSAIGYELNWNFADFELVSATRQAGLLLGATAFLILVSSAIVRGSIFGLGRFRFRVLGFLYTFMLVGFTHASVIGPDFAVRNLYLAVTLATLVLLAGLAILRLLNPNNSIKTGLAGLLIIGVALAALIVLNSKDEAGAHTHSLRTDGVFNLSAHSSSPPTGQG